MKWGAVIFITFLSLSLYGAMGSSVSVPVREHLKYTFGTYKNHTIQTMDKDQYYKSIAPMKEDKIRTHLIQEGYSVRGIKLRDIASELVYQVYVTDTAANHLRLYVDPSNGSILKTETLQ
jgi:hypothetical protein